MSEVIARPRGATGSHKPPKIAKEHTAAVNQTLDRVIEILQKVFGETPAQARAKNLLERELRMPEGDAFDPVEAGRLAVVDMQQAEGGAWTGAELEERFHLTPATLHKRRAEHRIVWWRDAKNRFHYPKWQFNEAGALLPGIQEVLQTVRSVDEWRVMRYFLAPRPQLRDRSPLALLRAGEVNRVTSHAKAHAEENSW